MRVAITGASGLLGRHLAESLRQSAHTVIAAHHQTPLLASDDMERAELDLLQQESIARFVATARADWIVHTGAIADVDRCEREPDLAYALNAESTAQVVRCVAGTGTRVLFVSTDYVFDGNDGPYDETAVVNPINVYGVSKRRGEEAVLGGGAHVVVRSASFLGVGRPGHPTFAETIVNRLLDSPPVLAATDQYSNITPVDFLAPAIVELITSEASGVYHVAGAEIISRYDLTVRLARRLGLPHNSVQGVPYASLKRTAPRPLRGGLLTRRPLTIQPPDLDTSLHRFVDQLRGRHRDATRGK